MIDLESYASKFDAAGWELSSIGVTRRPGKRWTAYCKSKKQDVAVAIPFYAYGDSPQETLDALLELAQAHEPIPFGLSRLSEYQKPPMAEADLDALFTA